MNYYRDRIKSVEINNFSDVCMPNISYISINDI